MINGAVVESIKNRSIKKLREEVDSLNEKNALYQAVIEDCLFLIREFERQELELGTNAKRIDVIKKLKFFLQEVLDHQGIFYEVVS